MTTDQAVKLEELYEALDELDRTRLARARARLAGADADTMEMLRRREVHAEAMLEAKVGILRAYFGPFGRLVECSGVSHV